MRTGRMKGVSFSDVSVITVVTLWKTLTYPLDFADYEKSARLHAEE